MTKHFCRIMERGIRLRSTPSTLIVPDFMSRRRKRVSSKVLFPLLRCQMHDLIRYTIHIPSCSTTNGYLLACRNFHSNIFQRQCFGTTTKSKLYDYLLLKSVLLIRNCNIVKLDGTGRWPSTQGRGILPWFILFWRLCLEAFQTRSAKPLTFEQKEGRETLES